MSIIKEWSSISEGLKQSGASLNDIENARKQFIADIPKKAKSAGLNDEQTQSAISAFDTFTKDQLTGEERYGVDNPIKSGIKQAGKEIYTALAQGAGRMVGGAARLYNDIGDNEKGTFADNLANAMEEDYQARDEAAGLGYQQAEGVRGFGKMMVQNIPQLAATYLPVAALKGTAALRGAKAAATAITAGKTVQAANAAKAAAIASTITKGSIPAKAASLALNYTGEYGDVSQTVAQKIKNTTVEELRNSKEYGAEFNSLEREYYQQGMSADEASQKAKEYLLDNIRERRADVGAAVNTALEWIAPNAVSAINKMGGKKAGSELTESAVADAIGNKRFSWGNRQEVANLGKQMTQEAAQEGYTEHLGEGAKANITNGDVDWGNVAHSAALGALGGGIMGHGVHTLTTGGLKTERAKVLQQLESISTGYQSATQAVADNKAKLDVLNANQGNLTAADIVAKQQLEDDIALNQQVANEYEKQLKEAGVLSTSDMNPNNPVVDTPVVDANVDTTQADDELKAMAERGDIPDFKMMTLQYGISPENLANMYGRHKKMAQLKTNVAEHIKQGDTQAAQEAMSQAGVKQEEADTILNEVIKVNTQPKEKTPLRSLSGLLAKNPNADFAKDVLPFLKKKHKINSTSEALALWNEARKATKSAMPIEQPLANAPQAEKAPISIPQSQTVVEPVSNNEATKVTTPSVVPMDAKTTPESVAEITPVVNNNAPIKDNAEPLVEHTTTKGKTIKGVVRKGITKEEAKLVDPYAFAKDGGFFIREKYLNPQEKNTNTATVKENIKQKAESVAKEVLAEVNLPKEQSTKTQQSNDDTIKDINGEYQHDQFPDVVATVSKTEKGYDINWGDEVQSFTGKNAAIKTKAALIKEKFNKKKPKQDGDGGVTIEPMPKKPVSPTNATQTTPNTTGEQIADVMDKTAKAITEAAHNKVVERVKNGEEIIYKRPDAIARVQQDERYRVEINNEGYAVVKNIKDAQGNWVKADMSNQSTQAEQRVENQDEIKDKSKTYGKNVVSVYLTQGGQDGFVIQQRKKNDGEIVYDYHGKFGAGSGHSYADMLKIINSIKSSKRGVRLGHGVEFETLETISDQATDLTPKKTPIQGKDVWMEVEFIAGNKSKELFYHHLMADPNKPFNTKAEAVADWESKIEQELKEKSSATIEKEKQSIQNQFDEKNGVISASDVTKIQAQTQARASAIGTRDGFVKFPEGAEYGDYTIMVNRGKYKQEQEVAALIMFKNDGTYRVVQSIFDSNPSSSGVFDKRNAVDEIIRIINTEKLKFEESAKPTPSENTVFTEDAANKARELLKRKLRGQLNSGIDPEMFVAGITLAGYHVEKGARTFTAYAKAMLEDLGIDAKPYLKSWYMGLKYDPRASGLKGMSGAAEVDSVDIDSLVEDVLDVTTPSQPNTNNVGERNKTPESNQVQRASDSGPAQDNDGQPDDGVSANSGGRRDGGNLSDESRKSKTRSQKSDVASTRNQSPKLGDSTRSTEPSDGANLRNYRIQPNELKRTGSWKATAEQNVQIVELVKTIIAENRTATLEEKALLTKFTGWGASEIANGIFPNQYGQYKDANWKALGERLESVLTPEEYTQAKRTTQYAHYTSEQIIRSVYAALSRFGFNGGSMIEPGMGVGLFNGLMPDSMANNSQYTGIEYDTITGNIAKLLYPDSNVIVGDFTQTKLPKNFFDVAVGNPPFGNIKIQSDPEYKKQGFLLHDYFFAKTIDLVKEGGLLVFVTSKGTMDKANDRARKYLSERADLVGAIRLPQTAFKDNAGTEVVTDVIFLRKRTAEQELAGEAWGNLQEITTPQGNASINEYFANHPEMILGKSALTSSQYKANEYTVEPITGVDIETLFSEAINNLPENIYRPQQGTKAEQAAVQRRDYDPKIKKEGGIYVADDGVLMQVSNGQGIPLNQKQNSKHELVDLKPKEKEWLKDYVGVRDALKQAQYDQLQDNANWQKSLDALNKIYDAFVKKHGFMLDHTTSERENEDGSVTITKRFKNKSIMGLDAESALINALEQINGDNSISKAPALLGRVINKPSTPVITSTQDAMFVMFNELGRFDLAKVAKLINKSEKDVIAELGNSIYEDPSQSWTTADDYLSGNVVRKLKEAEQAARLNPKYQRNVTALKTVQPPALAPQDINVQLGAAWIPASDVVQFTSEVLSERFRVNYSPLTGQWSVEGNANYSSEWGIPAKDSKDILEAVLNNRQIKVTFLDENKKTHTDTEKTEKANDIAKKMRQSFKKWLWEDVPRTERLATYYNEHFNNIAPRNFDGQHLTLPGVSSRFDLRPHQKRAIWRTIQQGDVYYAHAVGAGKTFTMIASGMEERRLGLVKKPMYVVPNHMLAQFSKEFLELYPMANIMVADETNFHTHNRRKFVAQAALNNPDAIVITHSAFGRIGMSSEYSSKFIQNQINDWQVALQEVGSDERITRKQIERRIEQLENKLKALLDGEKDQLLNFEELGVDRLYVDEGHEFRKLDFPTNRGNIKGIDPSGSQKSMDLYMKVEYLRSKNPNRALVMASGTPVTNTMGELFTVQRFFNPSQLEEDGDGSFDAWSAHYGEVVDGLEQNAAGGYETVSRFAKFVNVPELMSRVRYFMDILTSNQLGDLVQRPDVVGGGRQVIVTPAPDGYKDYQKDLEKRIKDIRNRKAPPKPGDDIILSVIADGRFSAIDMRFVDSTLPSDPNSKLNRMLDDLISAYHETANNEYVTAGVIDENKGSSLMLFTDIGLGEQSAKNRGFDMKAWIEKRLVEGGVKREHIAFMRDNKAHSKKEKLFDDMRKGKKRILIGGKDMETGVNAQKRLTHLFHLDAPWFPASVEQREGRIIRQGNQNKVVAIRAYASKGSYDSTMWGMNSRKARFIEQAMSGDSSIRNMEDVSEASAFEMAAALASGDDRYLKLAGLKGDVERLGRLYSAHIDEQKRFAREKAHLESNNKHSTSKIEQINKAIAQLKPIKAGEFLANVGKQSFDNREDFSKALFEKFKEVAESYKADEIELGSIAGFPIVYNGVELRGGNFAADLRVDLPIDSEPLAIFPIDPAYSVSGIATRAVNQTNALDRELVSRKSSIEQNTKDLARIGRRIGASFPEMAELSEKQQALNELEQELNAENKADNADTAAATIKSESVSFDDKLMSLRYRPNNDDDSTQVPRIQIAKELERLIAKSSDGSILEDDVKALFEKVKAKQDAQKDNSTSKDRVRGADWLIERLTRAKRTGELEPVVVDMALWFLSKNPNMANDVGLRIRQSKKHNYDGAYIPSSKVIELIKMGSSSPLGLLLQKLGNQDTRNSVGVHELLHHTERMIPTHIREGILQEWSHAVASARSKAAKNIDKPTYERLRDLDDTSIDRAIFEKTLANESLPRTTYYKLRSIDAIIESNIGDSRKLESMFDNGVFALEDYYLINSSEFWAVKGAAIISAKYNAKGVFRQAVQWLKGLYQQIRNLFGLPSDAPILKGLNAVMRGDGSFINNKMLSAENKILFSKSNHNKPIDVKGSAKSSGLTVAEAQKVADAFLKEYNGNIPLEIIVRDKQEDFYGEQASRENLGYTINGAYHPTKNIVSIVASTFLQPSEVRTALRHEILGHYGLNTFSPPEKLDILKKIINSKKALNDEWAKIDGLYSGKTELEKAEEVFAFTAENKPYSTLGEAWNSVLVLLNKALRKIGLIKDNLTYPELHKLAQSIAKGIRNGTRQQQTFPKSDNAQFRIELPTSSPERNLPQRSIRSAKNMAKFVGEFMTNIWTYKIGTKLDLALKNTRYKRVFDLVQAHLNHVSVEAYEAIELAPDLLGKLDTFEDYRKRLKTLIPLSGNFDERNKNINVAAKVIFDGTLIDKQEFSETQLRAKGLSDDQITIYKQARAAINISLKNAAKAEMTRVLLLANVIGEQVARVVTDRELNMDEHKQELLHIIDTKYQALKVKRDVATDEDTKAAIKQQMNDLVDVIKMLHSVTKKADKLIQEGYAPLMRYGDYTSSVYDAKGELVDFRMFESASARNEFVESLSALNLKMKRFDADNANYDDVQAKSHAGFKVITGTMNNSLFEQFKGITPETLALFADVSNLKQTEEYQQYLKLAVSNNSAFKRLIHRKGIVGYSEDLQRVVASFVMSNARRSAKNIYNKLENDAVNAIPKEQGHLQEDAQKLVNYINNPVEEAQQFRNILFLWNLGLSFMFGLVNLTQPFMVTIPKLSEYTTASNAALRVSAATRLAYSATQKGQAPKGFEIEYAQAQREGHLDPQNAFVLAGIERGSTGLGSSYWQSLSHGFGLIAQVTESMNRKTVFIASMQIGQELQKNGKLKAQGFDSPYDFAIRIIQETQGIYNKGNRGNFARGPFGTVLMMFKQYPIMMIQLMGRMAINPQYAGEKDKYRKALLLLLAMLWGAAGATGLPFARDILDVIETAFAWSGKPVNIEREIQIGLGKEAADWVMNGVNAISPVDVKGRMGMGDLLPATSIANYVAMNGVGGAQNKEVMQVLGAGGGLVQKFIDGASALGRGDYRNAAANLAPRSIESMVKGIEMGVTGVYTDRKGNKVRDVSVWDALAKFFDMNPAINARDSRTRGLEARDVMIQGSMARKFKAAALDALANNDMAAMDKVDAEVEKWNKDNPHYPVEIKARALYRKLRNANKTWQGRDEPPKGMEWMEQYR